MILHKGGTDTHNQRRNCVKTQRFRKKYIFTNRFYTETFFSEKFQKYAGKRGGGILRLRNYIQFAMYNFYKQFYIKIFTKMTKKGSGIFAYQFLKLPKKRK